MEMDPPIEAFIPAKSYWSGSQVEVADLEQLVRDSNVNDGLLVYGLLKEKGIEISNDLKHAFLELISYYNCDEPLDEEWIEERWFKQTQRVKERPRMTWKNSDVAEQCYHEIEPKEARTYSCIIRAMCKYYQVEKANAIFNDCIAKNIPLDVQVFNSIIGIGGMLKESPELLWTFVESNLKLMKERNVEPNLKTLNACLYTISQMGVNSARDKALQVIAEFKRIGIEPSLASYMYLLQIFCRDRNQVSHVLIDIMNEIEGKEFEIQDIRDTHFFVTAMEICRHHLFSTDLAKRVNALLHTGENYNLIGDSYKESNYYRYYFSLLIQTEPLETFMNESYFQLVPHVYIPEPSVMEELLRSIEGNAAIEHIPLIWSHMICFEHITRENLLNSIVQIMLQSKPAADKINSTNEEFAKIALDMYTKIEEKNENRSKPIVWTGKLLGDLLRLIARSQDIENASNILEKLLNEQHKVLGEPDFEALDDFVQLCILKKEPNKAIQCLQYSTEIGHHESKNLAKKICREFTLDESHMKKLSFYAGSDVVNDALDEVAKEKATKLN